MTLNYQIEGTGQPLILLHGLFGSLSNLAMVKRYFADRYQVISVDLRNHGGSPWAANMDHQAMALDVYELMVQHNLPPVQLIGHSLGGRVAMKLADIAPHKIQQLFVLDIAPKTYPDQRHRKLIRVLLDALALPTFSRHAVEAVLADAVSPAVSQFLMKSYRSTGWQFNIRAIADNYQALCDWTPQSPCPVPAYFLKGELSDFISEADLPIIQQQFPFATLTTIKGAGHNVHSEQTDRVCQYIAAHLR